MTILKNCKVHGDLTSDAVYVAKRRGKKEMFCKICSCANTRKYQHSNKQKESKRRLEWIKNNRKYFLNSRKRYRDELHDLYVKNAFRKIMKNFGWPIKACEIDPEIIECYRLILTLKRLTREQKQ